MKIERRTVLKGAASLPLAAVLADPLIARAVAQSLDNVTITTPNGRKVTGSVAWPQAESAPAIMLFPEWWGLNDQIKSVAAELAKLGYVAVGVDLYDGKVASDPKEAMGLMRAAMSDLDKGVDTSAGWVEWLRKNEKVNGKVGTIGWCFGGGWSLNASIARPVEATVIYYGNVTRTVDQLKKLKGPVMGHFGSKDKNINETMVNGFVQNMAAAEKPLQVYWYDADHAFANPTGNRFSEPAATASWERTTAFFKQHLG
jgi:carboxymethylenebutenolidase